MYDDMYEPPTIRWNEKSIVVLDMKDGLFQFYEDGETLLGTSMVSPELEDFEDQNKEKIVTYEMLYEMYDLARIVRSGELYSSADYQTQLSDF